MRTVLDLIDDLGRLDGARFDETVFELFHRGPRALDRLAAYWESGASEETRGKIRASIQSQWSRIQEVLVDLAPRAFGSAGVRLALSMGPTDSLARRAQRCIEQGRLDVAAAIASALAASGESGADQAVLGARIAMAAGRPQEAMSRLGGYCQATPCSGSRGAASVAVEWFARAAQDAGRPVDAFVHWIRVEPDAGAVAEIVRSLADAGDGPGLAACIAQAARSGEQATWELLAQAATAAVDDALGIHTDLVSDLFGMGVDIEAFVHAAEGVVADMEASMPAPAERSVAAELVSVATDACDMLGSALRLLSAVKGEWGNAAELISSFLHSADAPPKCGCDGDGQDGRWTWTCSGRVPEDALHRARLAALMHGALWRTNWKDGEFVVSVAAGPSGEVFAGAASASGPGSGWAASDIERMLKSLPPQDAADRLIRLMRCAQADHARCLLDKACQALSRMADAFEAVRAGAPQPALEVARIRAEHGGWLRCAAQTEASPVEAAREAPPPAAVSAEWSLPAELDCGAEAYQALRTAHMLIADESLRAEQAGLPAFLLQKAVQIEAERRLGDALAVHRLKPGAIAATRRRGKRRRELDPDFARDAISRAPQGISPDRIRGGLERLFARVLDGSAKPLSGDLFLAGLALIYLDPMGDPERSAALGCALLAVGEAAAAAAGGEQGRTGPGPGLARLERAAIGVLLAMGPSDGGEGES